MIDFKKMDEKDFVFVNKTLSDKEEKDFSAFLKLHKQKTGRIRIKSKVKEFQK